MGGFGAFLNVVAKKRITMTKLVSDWDHPVIDLHFHASAALLYIFVIKKNLKKHVFPKNCFSLIGVDLDSQS
jgi:hypothetical protein